MKPNFTENNFKQLKSILSLKLLSNSRLFDRKFFILNWKTVPKKIKILKPATDYINSINNLLTLIISIYKSRLIENL